MSLFRDLYATHGTPGDPTESGAAIAKVLRLTLSQEEALLPLIQHECANFDRNRVRSIESDAMAASRPVDPLAARRDLLNENFATNNGFVRWGQATVADHLARIEMLSKLRDGLAATIGRHEIAITIIETNGVNCLSDIDDLDMGALR